jgi:hypothetical protein
MDWQLLSRHCEDERSLCIRQGYIAVVAVAADYFDRFGMRAGSAIEESVIEESAIAMEVAPEEPVEAIC